MRWRLIPLSFFALFWPYTLEAPLCWVVLLHCMLTICTFWPRAGFTGLVFKPTFDHDVCKNQPSIPLTSATWHTLTRGKDIPLSVTDQFSPPCIEHRKVPLPGTRSSVSPTLVLVHYTIAFFYSFSSLTEKDKKSKYFKKSGNGTVFPLIIGS